MTSSVGQNAPRPLDGVLVVELASNVAGPFTGLVLRDLGARVLKIENPARGDDVRGWPPYRDGQSAPFAALNRGKSSVALDVTSHSGREAMLRLVAGADVFIESLRPGKADQLGLGFTDLEAANPRLVYCSISGFGRGGPRGGEAGFDAIVQAYSGLMDLTGYPDGPPARVGTGIIDFGTGLWAAIGILAALSRRNATGRGGRVEGVLLGTAVGLLMHHIASVTMAGKVPTRAGTAQHNAAPYEAIPAADGLFMVGVTNDSLWRRLCIGLSCSELVGDPRFADNAGRVANRDALIDLLSAAVGTRTAADAVARLRQAGVPASEIRSIGSLPDDEQVVALGLIQEFAGGERLAVSPIFLDGRAPDLVGAAVPDLGATTNAVLREIGYSESDLSQLRATGVIR